MKLPHRTYRQSLLTASLLSAALLAGCRHRAPEGAQAQMRGESCVLAGEVPAPLAFGSVQKGITVRSTYGHDSATKVYEEGKDYTVNYTAGTIQRTAHSGIPDYTSHVMWNKKDFNDRDYGDFAVWSNKPFFVYVDYRTSAYTGLADASDQGRLLPHFSARLREGKPVKIAWYGDSITMGRESSRPEYAFTHLYEQYLKDKYPGSDIHSDNISIIGYGSREGRDLFAEKFKDLSPDVVFIGFGMNDHNRIGIEPEAFRANLDTLADMVRQKFGADVVFYSTFPPNDNWYQSTHRMGRFAEATRQAAADTHSAYIDVYDTWMKVLKRKDQQSLLANNINHPNDFGHWLYEQAFEAMHF